MTETLRDIAIRLTKETDSQKTNPDKAIFVFGVAISGKTSLVTRWLGKSSVVSAKRTPGIEYLWTRKSNKLCHIWEFPELISTNIISTILRPSREYEPNIFLVVLDLSKPNSLTSVAQQILNNIEPFTDRVHNIVFVGSKYDIFQNLESELKKNVCKFLRGLALLKSAYLIFYSNEIPALAKRFGDLLNSLVWNSSQGKVTICKDYHTPIYVTPTNDSWDDLGIPQYGLEQLCQFYERLIRQK